MSETTDYDKSAIPTAHHTSHESGGGDEVTGTVLQDGTKPLTADWDIGNARKILADVIRARDADGLSLQDDGGNGIIIYDGGIVDISKQSACAVARSTNQAVATGTNTKVEFDTKIYDIQNEFDNVTNFRFTATKAGIYHAIGNLHFNSFAASYNARGIISKNGVINDSLLSIHSSSTNRLAAHVSIDVNLAANDYLEFVVWHNTGSNKDYYGDASAMQFTVRKVA